GGFIDTAEANATADIDFDTKARAFANSVLSAGNTLLMQSTTSSDGLALAFASSGGAASGSDANDTGRDPNDADSRGVRVGRVRSALTQTEVASGASLDGIVVKLLATVEKSRGTSDSIAGAEGAGSDSDALSRFEARDVASVAVRTGATVIGLHQLTMTADI